MKVLILGAAGSMSLSTIIDLLETANLSKIILSDLNLEKLEKRAYQLGDSRIETIKLDITSIADLTEVMKKVDVTINEAYYELNLYAMQAALQAKVPLIDLGGLYSVTKQQLSMHDEAKKAGVLIIPGIGSDPGTSNILCKFGSDKLDITDEIHIRYGSNWSGLTFTFAVGTILNEATESAVVFEKGKFVKVPPFSRVEDTVFRHPVGQRRTYIIRHSELATIPNFIKGVKTVTYHDSWDPEVVENINILKKIGLLSDKRVKLHGTEDIVKKQMAEILAQVTNDEKANSGWDSLQVRVSGKKNNNETNYILEVLTEGRHDENITPLAYMTGIPPSIAAQMIVRGDIKGAGVLPPEACIDPNKYLKELVKRKIELYETHSQTKKYAI